MAALKGYGEGWRGYISTEPTAELVFLPFSFQPQTPPVMNPY